MATTGGRHPAVIMRAIVEPSSHEVNGSPRPGSPCLQDANDRALQHPVLMRAAAFGPRTQVQKS